MTPQAQFQRAQEVIANHRRDIKCADGLAERTFDARPLVKKMAVWKMLNRYKTANDFLQEYPAIKKHTAIVNLIKHADMRGAGVPEADILKILSPSK